MPHVVLARRMRLPWVAALALACMMAIGAWGPMFARVLGGPPAHACHCETRDGHHAECACPVCFPEIGDVDALGHASVTGACGDAEHFARAHAMPAVALPTFVIAPPPVLGTTRLPSAERAPPSWQRQPPDEPPRASS